MNRSLTFVAAFILLATFAVKAQITQDHILNMQFVTSSAIDPAGKKIAYTLSVPRTDDEDYGGRYSELWTISTTGEDAKQVVAKPTSAWSPSWSSDGKKLYFLARIKEKHDNTQLYYVTKKSDDPVMVTEHSGSISSYHWSPNGELLAFIASDAMSEEEKKAIKEGKDWIVDDGATGMKRLWIMKPLGKGTQTYALTDGKKNMEDFAWSPDNKTIAYQATEKPTVDHTYMFKKIYTMNIDDQKSSQLCETQGKLGGMAWSTDGSKLAYLGAVSLNDPIAQSLFVVPSTGGTPKNLTKGVKYSANEVFWTDENTIGLLATENSHSSFYKINATSGKASNIYKEGVIIRGLAFDSKNEGAAFLATSQSHPTELYSSTGETFTPKRLTASNPEMDKVKKAKQEIYHWKGADDWDISGILTYPMNYEEGKKYPLILQIHGGPEGVSMNGWTTRSLYPVQWLAAKGYFVLEPNYRGSGGFGVDFSKADHDDLGGKEFDDVIAGIDKLVADGMVNGEQVGTGGWSYGGYFSAWAATRHSKRFKASVMAAGIANWVSFTGTTDIPYEMSLVHWNSWWFDKPELHWMRSPLAHVNSASTPTLVVHGLNDLRVPPGQAYELYTALKIKEVPTSMVLYPREPHGIRERAHERDYMDRILGWFDTYVKGEKKAEK